MAIKAEPKMSTESYASKSKKTNNSNSSQKIPFTITESYKNIRTNILALLSNSDSKVISFSSPNASEGKSTTSINIALALSQLNKKVLLLDADTHRPTIHKKLKLDNSNGYMNYMAEKEDLESVIDHYNPFLDVITSGPATISASELFSSPKFDAMLEYLKEIYDYIIVDTPPVNLISDSLIIAQKCDALVLVIRSSSTTYESFKKTVSGINVLKINLLGVVLNRTNILTEKYYKYKSYKYKY